MTHYIVLDCETTNSIDDPICYDIGWLVCDEQGNEKVTRSFVVADIFLHEPELMSSAYYAEKIPRYRADLDAKTRLLRRFNTIYNILYEDCKRYNVEAIIAHNMRFDYRATALTQRWLTCSQNRWFFPYGVKLWDSLKMARQTFGKDEAYKNFCRENDLCCKNGTPRLTAEALYKYISGNVDFEESHTGLEDTKIEKEIFLACLAMNPNIEKNVWSD